MLGSAWALAGSSSLAACVTVGESGRPIEGPTFEAVVRQVKYDLGTYLWRHRDEREPLPAPDDAAPQNLEAFNAMVTGDQYRAATDQEVCTGEVFFMIVKVKLSVQTTFDTKIGGSAGLKVPLGPVVVGPKASMSRQTVQTMTTTLEFIPETMHAAHEAMTEAPTSPGLGFSGHPIADTLDALRLSLQAAADTRPCFTFGADQDQKSNSVKMGFTVTETRGGGFSLDLFSLGAEGSRTEIVANTIEMFFVSHGEFG